MVRTGGFSSRPLAITSYSAANFAYILRKNGVIDTDVAQLKLNEAVEALIAEDNAKFGFSSAALARARHILVMRGAHDRLIPELQAALQRSLVAGEKLLEVGSGTATFLYALLERGLDAFGIDNSQSRLNVAHAKIPLYGFPDDWRERLTLQDASKLAFESSSFDIVVGHQFIEHVGDIPSVLFELVRVTRRGGSIVLWAPDYRGPFEAHYEIPWPPFASPSVAEAWVAEFGKPAGGIADFNYVTLPQVAAILQGLQCDITRAWLDKELAPELYAWFDTENSSALRLSAQRIQEAMKSGSLPVQLMSPTSFGIVARKR
jgi:ubiquinone/menaquinone biosynthesis C-methylase UbiE